MSEKKYNFNNPEIREKAIKASKTPEAKARQAASNHQTAVNRKATTAIMDAFRRDLFEMNKKGSSMYEEFLTNLLKEARANPNSNSGMLLARIFLKENMLEMLDEEQNKQMARDLDFMRYRVIKRLFREQMMVTLDVDHRKKCVICSRRAGKTDSNSTNLLYTCVTPDSPCLYINKTFRNAIDQLWTLLEDQANNVGLTISDGTSKSEGVMKFSNGSFVKFGGNNNDAEADKYRGGKYRLVIIDEAGHQRNMQYLVDEVIGPALSDYADSQLILTGTPPRVPHTYVEKCWNSPEYTQYHWTMLDNPHMPNPQEVIDGICREKGLTEDSPFIQREYFGKIGAYDTEAMVFKDRQTLDDLSFDNCDITPTHFAIGVDFGYADYNGIVTLAYNTETREARVLAESKFNKATISEIVNSIQSQYEKARGMAFKFNIDPANVEVFCDNNEKSIVSELYHNYNINAHCAWKYDKAMAMAQLAEELRTGRMRIKKGGAIDDEMDSILYKRDEATDAITAELDEDLGIHPDIVMALLYASRQYFHDLGIDAGGRTKSDI